MTDDFAQAYEDRFSASVMVDTPPVLQIPSMDTPPDPAQPKAPVVTEKQLLLDPKFAASARDIHLLFEGEPFDGDDQMAARYGIDAIGEFNYNFAGPAGIPGESGVSSPGTIGQEAALLTSGSQDQAKSFVYLMDRYDQLPNFTLAGTGRMIRGMVADPSVYTGFGTLALGFAARKTGAVGIKKALVEIAKRPGTSAAVYTGVEAGAADQLTQAVEERAGYEIDPATGALRTAITSVVGGAAGGGLVKGGEMLAREFGPAIGEAISQAGQSAEARMAERGPITDRVMSGADPMEVIDPALAVAGKLARGAEIGQGSLLSEAGEAAIKTVGSLGTNRPLTKENLEKADEVTKLLVSKILKANPDAALGLARSGSAAGDSNYLTFVNPDGAIGQIRISDHSTGERRMSDYFEMLPMKIPPEGEQVFGQISRRSFDNTIDKIVNEVAFGGAGKLARGEDELKTVLDLRAEQMKLPVGQRVQPSTDNVIFNLETKPGDNQSPYELNMPEQNDTPVPRAPEGVKLPLNNRGAKVIEMSDKISDVLADRARPLVGSNVQYFYHTGPLIDKAVELGIPEEEARQQLKKFALNYAATSPRTMTEQNLRNASLVTAKQKRGVDLTEMIGPGGEGVNEKGYPMMINPGGIHKKLVDEAAVDGLNFNTNPKPATFAENVSGNLSGVTADTHAIRAVFDAMNEIEPGSIPIEFIGGKNAKATKEMRAQYLADPSSLDPATMINDTLATQKINGEPTQTEYAIFSDIYKKVAEKIGVRPAEAQSLSWFANGKKTGLASDPKTIVELIDERVDVTSQMLGQSKDEVFKKFMKGSIPLLSFGGLTLLDTGAMQQEVNEEM